MSDSEKIRELKIDADAEFHWSVGEHMEKFIRGLGEKRLLGVRCPSCKRVLVPPRKVCDRCFARTDEWVEVGPGGTVVSFTLGHVEIDEKSGGLNDIREPRAIALIRPDGADSSMVHLVGEAEPEGVESSMRVRAVWAEEPAGKLTDLRYFKPT